MDEDTLRVTYAAPRDSIEQGVHILPEEDKAKPVVLVTISPKNTDELCTREKHNDPLGQEPTTEQVT